MTSNEGKILKVLYNQKGGAQIRLIARHMKFSNDYMRLICRSLERTGYLTLIAQKFCQLSPKGRGCVGLRTGAGLMKAHKVRVNAARVVANAASVADFLAELRGASADEKERLRHAGYKTIETLASAPVNKLIQEAGISLEKAAHWINQAKREMGIIGDEASGG